MSLSGDGRSRTGGSVRSVAGWWPGRGRPEVAARAETAVAINGFAEVARLLPPEFAPLLGESLADRSAPGLPERTARFAIDDLTVALASGSMTGHRAFRHTRSEDRRQLRASLSRFGDGPECPGCGGRGSAEVHLNLSGTEQQPHLELTAIGDNLLVASSAAEHAAMRA